MISYDSALFMAIKDRESVLRVIMAYDLELITLSDINKINVFMNFQISPNSVAQSSIWQDLRSKRGKDRISDR
ncbi:MAG: hypothetical protein RBR15_10420 [Sphaerochaeta sp.]|nr:hypothetical protein [Sphaerochaeta sp.]